MTHISERCAPVPKKKSTGMSQRQSFLDRGVISENRAILRYNEELEREARQTERGETGPPDGGRREPGRREGGRRPESGLRTDRPRSDDRTRRAGRPPARREPPRAASVEEESALRAVLPAAADDAGMAAGGNRLVDRLVRGDQLSRASDIGWEAVLAVPAGERGPAEWGALRRSWAVVVDAVTEEWVKSHPDARPARTAVAELDRHLARQHPRTPAKRRPRTRKPGTPSADAPAVAAAVPRPPGTRGGTTVPAGVTGSATVSAGTAVTGSPAGTVVPPRVLGGLGAAAARAGAAADGVTGLRERGRRLAGVRGCCRARWRSSSATAVRAGRASGWDLTHSSVTASTTTAHDRRSAPHSAGPRSPAGTASTASQPMSLARLSWSPRTSRPTSRLPPAAMPASSAAADSTALSADSSSTDAARGGSRRAGGRAARRVRSSDRGRSVPSPDSGRRPPSRRPGSRRPPSGGPVSPRSVCLASRSSSSLYRRIARFSEMTPRSRNDWRWLMPVDFFFGTGAHLSLMWVIRSHAGPRPREWFGYDGMLDRLLDRRASWAGAQT